MPGDAMTRGAMAGGPVVALDGVSRCYRTGRGRVMALHAATASVGPGERVALVGPSGSGKSTLLHLAAGLEAPDEGRVTWPRLGDRQSLRPLKVGLAFQGPTLLPPLTVEENVALPLLLGGVAEPHAHERSRRMLRALGLAELAARLPEELSGGETQRVGMARALVVEPELLLADEPTGQLDGVTARDFLDRVLHVLAPTAAAIIATHDERVARHMTRRWALSHGRLRVPIVGMVER